MNIREKTCCFTGHRDIPRAVYSSLSRELDAVVRALIGKGVRFFGAGGALGFDTLAAETVLRLRQIYPQIRLFGTALPRPDTGLETGGCGPV